MKKDVQVALIKQLYTVFNPRNFRLLPAGSVGRIFEVVYEDTTGGFWRVRRFTGICIGISGSRPVLRLTLRNVFSGIPVEFSFDLASPCVIAVTKTAVFRVFYPRAKLYYLRWKNISRSSV